MEQSACQQCGDDIDLVDGKWVSDADDVCGADLRRDHRPIHSPAMPNEVVRP